MKSITKTLLVASLLFLPGSAFAGSGLIAKPSPHSVQETLDRFETVLKKKGITVFARIDHAAGAKSIGQKLLPTQVIIFGTPKIGTALMTANRRVGIDLPLKALAWKDAEGKVWLAYRDPAELKLRYQITSRDKVFAKISKALDGLSNAAVK